MARARIRYGKFLPRLLLLILLVYGMVRGGLWLYDKSRQITAQPELTQVTRKVSGYVLRDENPIISANGGAVSYYVQDGDKVQKGQKIATIIASGEAGPVGALTPQQQVEANQKRLQTLDAEIQTLMNGLSDGVRSRRLVGIAGIKSDLTMKLSERKKLASAIESIQSGLKPEADSGASAVASKGQRIDVVSPDAGTVSFYSDGMEDVFQPAAYRSLNLKGLALKEPAGIAAPQIKPGGMLFKLVSGTEWYLAVPVTPADRKTLDKIREVSLKINQESVKASVQDTLETPGGNLLILQVRSPLTGFSKLRKLDCEMTLDNYRGISVPLESVVSEKNQKGVVRITSGGNLSFVPVEVISEAAGKYVLSEGSFYTQEGTAIRETNTIRQGDRILRDPGEGDLKKIFSQE